MSLEKIIQAILGDGRREAILIVEEGKREKERLLGEANEKTERFLQERKRDAYLAAERLKTKERAKAEIEAKRMVLRAQKEVIDQVYALAMKRLSESSFVETIIKLKSSELKDSSVYCSKKDESTVKKAIVSTEAKFGGTIDCAGGLVMESADGKVKSDYRVESILKSLWDDSVIEIVTILWDER